MRRGETACLVACRSLIYEVADLVERLLAHFDAGQVGALGTPDAHLEFFEDGGWKIGPEQHAAQGIAAGGVGVVARQLAGRTKREHDAVFLKTGPVG